MTDVPVVTLPRVATMSGRSSIMNGGEPRGPSSDNGSTELAAGPASVPVVRLPQVATPIPRPAVTGTVTNDATAVAVAPADVPVVRLPKVVTPIPRPAVTGTVADDAMAVAVAPADVPVVRLPKVATPIPRPAVTGTVTDDTMAVAVAPADVPVVRLPKVVTPIPRPAVTGTVTDDAMAVAVAPADVPVVRLPQIATARPGTTTLPTSPKGTGSEQHIGLDAGGGKHPKGTSAGERTPAPANDRTPVAGPVAKGGTNSQSGKSERQRYAAAATWTWLLPLALLGLGAIWWLLDSSSTRTHIAQLTEKLGHESTARAKAETALAKAQADAVAATAGVEKARADLATATTNLRSEGEARRAVETNLALLQSRLGDETKRRIELEQRAVSGLAVDGKELADTRSEVTTLRRELGLETERRTHAERTLAELRGATGETIATLRSELEAEKRRMSSEADARKIAEDEVSRLRQQLSSQAPDTGKLAAALASIAQLESQVSTEQAARRNDLAALSQQLAAEKLARQTADAELKALQGRLASASAGVSELKVCRDSFKAATASGPIEFEFASATITQASIPTLDRVADAIRKCPWAEVRVEGNTDQRGSFERNKMWSEARAKAVVDYLARQPGIDASRLTPIGYAHLNPLDRSGTPEAEARNRRIDFVVVIN